MGEFTQEDPIGLAGGLNLYGYAGGDPVNGSDPFGLCPPQNTDVSDCGSGNLADGWRALDASGKSGKAVIQGIVDAQLSVAAGSAATTCGSAHSCFNEVTNAITVEASDLGGAIAVELAHEYAHFTQIRASDSKQYAANEMRAWDKSAKVFGALTGIASSQATAAFGAQFGALKPGSATRALNLKVWQQQAVQRYGPP